MKHRLLYNHRSRPLVVSRENAALTQSYFLFLVTEAAQTGYKLAAVEETFHQLGLRSPTLLIYCVCCH